MSEKVVRTRVIRNWRFNTVESDLSEVFDVGNKVVVILESEYDRLKRLDAKYPPAPKRCPSCEGNFSAPCTCV